MGLMKPFKILLLTVLFLAPLTADEAESAIKCEKAYDACWEKCESAKKASEQCYDECEEAHEECISLIEEDKSPSL